MVQDARIQRVLEFLKAPSQLSDKDLASKVCACVFVHLAHGTLNCHVVVSWVVMCP